MKKYLIIISLIILYDISGAREMNPYFYNSKKLAFCICYDMGGLFFKTSDGSIRLGGLLGINSALNIRLFKFYKILGLIHDDITYNY